MTQLAHQPLQRLKDQLVELVAEGNSGQLAELLLGRDLPALGGDQAPADLLLQALELHPFDPELARAVAALSGQVLTEQATRLTSGSSQQEEVWSYGAQTIVYNGLLLACDLPANEALFDAVKRWHRLLVEPESAASDYPQLPTLGRHALIHQQTDDSLESYWLALIDRVGTRAREQDEEGGLTSDDHTLVLEAWRGLLWIPPDEQQRKDGAVISFDRINRGVLHLEAVLTEQVEHDEAAQILSRAFRILQQTYPRSSAFWLQNLEPFRATWGKALQIAANEAWPLTDAKMSAITEKTEAISQEMRDLARAVSALQKALRMFETKSEVSNSGLELWLDLVKDRVSVEGRISDPQEIEKAAAVVGTLSSSISRFLSRARGVRKADDEEEELLAGDSL